VTEVLYPNGYSSTGGPGAPVPMSKVKARADWKMFAPEFARRIEALMIFGEGRIGLGGGGRSTAGQTQLFLSRYHEDPNGSILWDGKRWTKNPGVASAAPPGRSYHEDDATPQGAVAADMVGDLTILRDSGHLFGLIEFHDVNNEPWHAQPLELPHARSEYVAATMAPLHPWTFPGPPPPPPQPGVDMELAVMTLDNTQPPTTFLGYVDPAQSDLESNKFWKVYWIDGNDPQAMKMLADQRAGGAKEYHFGEHVSVALFYENDRLPASVHSDGRPWAKSDWGAAPLVK